MNYYVADHLGASRVVTNSSGTVLDDSDFYPFGGERLVVTSSGNSYKFTGKEWHSTSVGGLGKIGASERRHALRFQRAAPAKSKHQRTEGERLSEMRV